MHSVVDSIICGGTTSGAKLGRMGRVYKRAILRQTSPSFGFVLNQLIHAGTMPDKATRRLLQEIDDSSEIQEYMKEVCDDMLQVLREIGTCVNFQRRNEEDNGKEQEVCSQTRYEQTMHLLMNLGTMRNSTHPGSVRNCDVAGVFQHGNIRERCAVLMNLLCHDKKFGVMRWLLGHITCADSCEQCCTHEDPPDKDGRVYTPLSPALLNTAQVLLYKNALGMCSSHSKTHTSSERCAKKDIRKALCRIVKCPRKKSRVARAVEDQQQYALRACDAVPRLSRREWALQRGGTANTNGHAQGCSHDESLQAPYASKQCDWHDVVSRYSVNPAVSTHTQDTRKNEWHRWAVCEKQAKTQKGLWTALRSDKEAAHMPIAYQPTRHQSFSPHYTTLDATLPWVTGHMCWEMVQNSAFFMQASCRHENTIAGPSGHTHTMLTFMNIFCNFDVEKWTLVCLVWLVGADHHSVLEVLYAASHHGLHIQTDIPSLDAARNLLCRVRSRAEHKKVLYDTRRPQNQVGVFARIMPCYNMR